MKRPRYSLCVVLPVLLGVACFNPGDDSGSGGEDVADTVADTETTGTTGTSGTDTDVDTTTTDSETDSSSSDTETTAAAACNDGSVDPGELCLGELVEYPLGQPGLRMIAGELDAGVMGVAVVGGANVPVATVLRGDGSGGLLDPELLPLASPATYITAGDVDQDGDLDLLASGAQFSVLRNDGNGGWEGVDIDPGFFPGGLYPPALGQIDGNPPLDIVYGEGYNTVWILGNDQGGWSPGAEGSEQFTGGDSWLALTEFGFDGDGFTDVMVASRWVAEVHFARGQGNGSFTPQGVAPACNDGSCEIVELHAADLNGDENPDIIASLDIGLSVIMGKDDGTFDAFTLIASPGADFIASGDVDNDGDIDLLVASSTDGDLRLFLGDGAGGLGEPQVFATPAGELRTAAIADMDQDGAPELLTAYTYNGGGWVGVIEASP